MKPACAIIIRAYTEEKPIGRPNQSFFNTLAAWYECIQRKNPQIMPEDVKTR